MSTATLVRAGRQGVRGRPRNRVKGAPRGHAATSRNHLGIGGREKRDRAWESSPGGMSGAKDLVEWRRPRGIGISAGNRVPWRVARSIVRVVFKASINVSRWR